MSSRNSTGGRKVAQPAPAGRYDTVFIRKSTAGQDEGPQRANVEAMLRTLGIRVPEARWFSGTVSRRKVKANAEFNRLMEQVEADRVGTVYVESQDRWGTGDRPELFSLLGTLRQHGTRLFDLRAGKDLTEKDLATELLAFVGSIKSEKELQDIAYRSLRSRVNNFKNTGSWPTGTHPYGYGKMCSTPDGKPLWVWQPVNRSRGQIFYPAADGPVAGPGGVRLAPGPDGVKIPRKARGQLIRLVPSNDPGRPRAVRLTFDLYTRVGLSRRQVSVRLNAEGLKFNGRPFTQTDVRRILLNPAYAGDIHFGKEQTGCLHTFDPQGVIVEVKSRRQDKNRDTSECLVRENTHEALVARATWELARAKLADEAERTSHSPQNPAYYLKQLLVCGHCGQGMTGRTENYHGGKVVIYVCSSYVSGKRSGYRVPCGYYHITHEEAEHLLLDKITELDLPLDDTASEAARANLHARLDQLRFEGVESIRRLDRWIAEGVRALTDYLDEVHGPDAPAFRRLRELARYHYQRIETTERSFAGLCLDLTTFKQAIQEAEAMAVAEAQAKLEELAEEHRSYTKMWAKATDRQQGVLKEEIQALEAQMEEWEERAVPLAERLDTLRRRIKERAAERSKLLAEWPTLEGRERGEALRRLFKTVTLFWERAYHPSPAKPSRPHKTNRQGRYICTLQRDKIGWAFAEFNSERSSTKSPARVPGAGKKGRAAAPCRRAAGDPVRAAKKMNRAGGGGLLS
jgi:hypothetical protein